MAFTKEDLQKLIEEEKAKIQNVQTNADNALAKLQAEANNAVGNCQGKIEIYESLLKELETNA